VSVDTNELSCGDQRRRATVRAHRRNGIDEVEAADDGRTLTVTFLGRAPHGVGPDNVRVDGGRRITGIRVLDVDVDREDAPDLDDRMHVRIDRAGDTSVYTLRVVEPAPHGGPGDEPYHGFDPRYAHATFTFRPQCPTDHDCAPVESCPPAALPAPVIDYTAKDYASLRRLLLDRMTLTVPQWAERHAPDLELALVEILAYTGDRLSYLQDAVATEAYLDTARRRESVRRHVRLVDYAMHDGCNARTFVSLETCEPVTLPAGGFRFAAVDAGRLDPRDRPDLGTVITDGDLAALPAGATPEVFEPLVSGDISLRPEHNAISFWTWGDAECCLPAGATGATLRDACTDDACPDHADDGGATADGSTADRATAHGATAHGATAHGATAHGATAHAATAHGATDESVTGGAGRRHRTRALRLAPGDILVIEEVVGPRTGAPADADPGHRQAVRLTSVTPAEDALYDQPVIEVTWAPEDALRFPVCLSTRGGPDCRLIEDVSVVRGNVVPVDHGRTLTFGDAPPEPVRVPLPQPVDPGCAGPDFGCGDQPGIGCGGAGCGGSGTSGPARGDGGETLAAIHALLAEARTGRPLGAEDLAALRPLVGDAALDRAGLVPDAPAAEQAAALEALAGAITYPPVPARFRPVLRGAPVTQRTPYPAPAHLATAQARLIATVPDRARTRVDTLWRSARGGHPPDQDETAELTVLFGPDALASAHLSSHPAQALAWLLTRFDTLLATKLRRLAVLAARAAGGTVLGPEIGWEIRHAWGEPYADGLDPGDPVLAGPAASVAAQDPRDALPALWLRPVDSTPEPAGKAGTPAGTVPGDAWTPRRDLLSSGPRDRHVVGELGDDGHLALRFGDGLHGLPPPAGAELDAYYRTGNGAAGNVGAEAVNHLVLRGDAGTGGVTRVRNPVPATGGVDPEPVEVVRTMAPLALHRTRPRAVTAGDYADLAAAVPGVARAAARLRYTGWTAEVHVAVDPVGTGELDSALVDAVTAALEPYRRIGHDVVVGPAELVPLDVEVRVCVATGYQRGHVVDAVRAALGSGVLPAGRLGFFHPDALTFGDPVRVSRLVATAAAVPGVASAQVTVLRRLFEPDNGELAAGLLAIAALQIAQCDNASDRPENGRLSIVAGGGQ
jgi:predicted phage baseplate assembly protein